MGHVLWNVTAHRCAAATPSRRPGETLGSLLRHLAPWMNRAALAICLASVPSFGQNIGDPPETKDMALVGYHDLQARSAYQPLAREQNGRWILYVGDHGTTEKVPK